MDWVLVNRSQAVDADSCSCFLSDSVSRLEILQQPIIGSCKWVDSEARTVAFKSRIVVCYEREKGKRVCGQQFSLSFCFTHGAKGRSDTRISTGQKKMEKHKLAFPALNDVSFPFSHHRLLVCVYVSECMCVWESRSGTADERKGREERESVQVVDVSRRSKCLRMREESRETLTPAGSCSHPVFKQLLHGIPDRIGWGTTHTHKSLSRLATGNQEPNLRVGRTRRGRIPVSTGTAAGGAATTFLSLIPILLLMMRTMITWARKRLCNAWTASCRSLLSISRCEE